MKHLVTTTNEIDWKVVTDKKGSVLHVNCPFCGLALAKTIQGSAIVSQHMLPQDVASLLAGHLEFKAAPTDTDCSNLLFLTGDPTYSEFDALVRGVDGKLWLWREWLDRNHDHCWKLQLATREYIANEIVNTEELLVAKEKHLKTLQQLQ